VREAQKGKLLWLLTLLACIFTRKTAKFNAAGLCRRQFQPKNGVKSAVDCYSVIW